MTPGASRNGFPSQRPKYPNDSILIMPKNSSPIECLAEFALAALPDSLSQRKHILRAAVDSLPKSSELRTKAAYMLRLLDEHEAHQPKLPLFS